MTENTQQDEPKSVVEVVDHAAAAKQAAKDEERKTAAALRAAHVEALENEKAYLTRQPKPNKSRLADVDAQIDEYSKEPKAHTKETATTEANESPAAAPAPPAETAQEAASAPTPAPAKKTAAKKTGS